MESKKNTSDLIAVLIIVVGTALLFIPALLQWRGIFHNDQAMSEFPQHVFLARNLQQGIIPLWNPHLWCGAVPYYAFLYSGHSYYLVLWPFYLLANLKDWNQSYYLITLLPLLLHYVLAAAGMFFLLRKALGLDRTASFVGALAYSYSPAFAYAYVSQNNLIMQSWLPWLIFVFMKTVQKFSLWKLFLGAVIVSFIWFGSSPQYIPFVVIIWAAFALFVTTDAKRVKSRNIFRDPLVIAAIMFFLGTALSSPYVLSLLEGSRYTSLHKTLQFAAAISDKPANLDIPYLVTLILPNFLGSITGDDFIARRIMFWDANMAGGIAVTFLVFLTFILIFFKEKKTGFPRKLALLALALYLISILCVLGGNTPFYKIFVGWVPVVSGLPFPIRYRFIQCFSVSILVSLGIDILTRVNSWIDRSKVQRMVRIYAVLCITAVTLVLILPTVKTVYDTPDVALNEHVKPNYFSERPVGVYLPKVFRVKKIKAFFDGESSGEIRTASDHLISPREGVFLRKYHVPEQGWAEFDVRVAPGKFLWIVPKSGSGRIGYWPSSEHSFSFFGKWHLNRRENAIAFVRRNEVLGRSLFDKIKNGDVISTAVLRSLGYLAFGLITLIFAARFLTVRRFGWFVAVCALMEFYIFANLAFYKGTFNEEITSSRAFLPHNERTKGPREHPVFAVMAETFGKIASGHSRIATDYPFYDNFSYMNGKLSLMGEPAFPLEKRFKRAIEKAYGQVMEPYLFYEGGGAVPADDAFLNNFSVGYFLSASPKSLFAGEKVLPLESPAGLFIHVNPDPLPRVYTLDRVEVASEERQLEQLVSGDLQNAVCVSSGTSFASTPAGLENVAEHFKMIQDKNLVTKIDDRNPNQLDIDADIRVPAMLVVTDVWFPGWEATVDGVRTQILRVNYCQRGIWLGKGFHQVRFKFRPFAWRLGVWVSLGALGTMLFLLLMKRKKTP